MNSLRAVAPGLAACLAVAVASVAVNMVVPIASPLLVAILAGVAWRTARGTSASWAPGVGLAGRQLLRVGIVLLGLQVSLLTVAALGPATLTLVAAAVGVTFAATAWLGRRLGLGAEQSLLVAAGFSICGAAAIAAAEGVTDADEEEVARAVALVVVFGTGMIVALPVLVALLGMTPTSAGLWIGASTHEVAQVVAAAGLVGDEALGVAVTVKLARVALLAPVMAVLAGLERRRIQRLHGVEGKAVRLPPVVPLFVVGFLVAMAARTTGLVPEPLLTALGHLQQLLLAAAMFALGLGVDLRALATAGREPLRLGAVATLLITGIGLAGAVAIG
ncbi:putative sulfate exporter family transporter [Tessaracoccus sp. MC1627]|uniref:YeiH family protein n=1 Tax=Tessaracoccus sp. MC1627 TaxID=2760312 RepID=UPI001C727653